MDRMLCITYAKRHADPCWPYEEGWGAKAEEAGQILRMASSQRSSPTSVTLPR